MSIQIGNTSYSIPTQALDGAQGMVQTSASGQPGLGAADLSNINSKQWETLKSKDGIQLSAPRTADGGDTNGLSSKLDAMSQITDIYSVMALFQKMSQDARTVAREQRHAEMQAQMEAMGAAADKMRSAALKRLIGTCVQAGVQAVGGFVKMGTAGVSIKGTLKADSLSSQGRTLSEQAGQTNKIASRAAGSSPQTIKQLQNEAGSLQARANSFNNQAQAMTTRYQSATQIANGAADVFGTVGTVVSGGFEYMASLDDAAKVDLDKQAELHRAARERANDTMQDMKELIRDIQAKLSELDRSASDTAKQITRA